MNEKQVNLNKEQQEAVLYEKGPLLIVAGAGTGKTKVVTSRIAWLILEKGINVDQILALTFSQKAANEMVERLDLLLPYGYVDLWISTYHAFCEKILRKHALDIGMSTSFKLLDELGVSLLVRKNWHKFNLDYYHCAGNPTKFIGDLLKHFSRCKDEGISPANYLDYANKLLNDKEFDFLNDIDSKRLKKEGLEKIREIEFVRIKELADAFFVYEQILADNDVCDFSDLLAKTVELFKKRPQILVKYQQQFKYILVDEFQDTNFIQYELVKLLSAPENNLTVVGDDDQSIYKFRGASVSNIMQFKTDYPKAKEVVLTKNYRSSQEILDLSYNFIVQNNPDRLEALLGVDKKLKADREEKGIIACNYYENAQHEALGVVEKIKEIREQSSASWSDFAILIRANNQADPFIEELEKQGIPYQFVSQQGLYNRPVVLDLLSYFKLLDNYHESSAMYRVLNFPCFGLEALDIIKIVHLSKKKAVSIFEMINKIVHSFDFEQRVRESCRRILENISKHTKLTTSKKSSEIFLSFLHDTGYLKQLNSQKEAQKQKDLKDLNLFYEKIKSLESQQQNSRIKDFLELIEFELDLGDLGKIEPDPNDGPELVKISSVHQSKGLEFDYVFIANLADQRFPSKNRNESIAIPKSLTKYPLSAEQSHLQEERRLFYVAMTRARRGLFLSFALNYGGEKDKKPSRFFVELKILPKGESLPKGNRYSWQVVRQKEDNFMPHYDPPKRFSFSQISTYQKCPLQYKFSNILKIPTFGSPQFSFGTTIHNVLQKFLEEYYAEDLEKQKALFSEKKEKPGITRLLELYEDGFLDDWYKNQKMKEEYYLKGKTILHNFFYQFQKNNPTVQYLEQSFNFKIGEAIFTGRIDRIDKLADGSYEIIDYKTGTPKDKLEKSDKQQLLFYQIIGEEFLNLPLSKLSYEYLEDGSKCSFLGKNKEKEELKETFLTTVKKIKEGDFSPKPNGFSCKYCDYRNICEHKKI